MTESEVRLAILIVAAVIIGSVLAIAGCIAMSTKSDGIHRLSIATNNGIRMRKSMSAI